MKKFPLLLCAFFAASALVAVAEPATAKVFAVTSAGAVPAGLTQRLADWAARNLAVGVTVLPALEGAPQTLEAAAEKGIAARAPQFAGVVVLAVPAQESAAHGIMRPEQGVAVINVPAMRGGGASEEVTAFRLERQVIRGICMLLGLENSPNPQSAMFAYDSLAGLDAIGRNLDPPWLIKVQKAALAKGVSVDRENPFCLVN